MENWVKAGRRYSGEWISWGNGYYGFLFIIIYENGYRFLLILPMLDDVAIANGQAGSSTLTKRETSHGSLTRKAKFLNGKKEKKTKKPRSSSRVWRTLYCSAGPRNR
ncbi:hypothetical protein H072_10762 [Dactylellina haptotyla CBS 200.50]|uniref:Uncharacterized protein n=1 Tax=Dactylellina haptotyla (strain CBS 200.50) TaxID=1284197 RepID=S8A3X5_DACHA|nr:hypothetical protein H072_10762 [Dactylellina haptotyla CBS 200.50]